MDQHEEDRPQTDRQEPGRRNQIRMPDRPGRVVTVNFMMPVSMSGCVTSSMMIIPVVVERSLEVPHQKGSDQADDREYRAEADQLS